MCNLAKKMKLFGLTVVSLASADVTQYKDANGNTITIDPGCPTLWPKNQDKDTVLPYWKGECPPIDLCYPNVAQHVGTAPYNARCKDADGNKDRDNKSNIRGYTVPGPNNEVVLFAGFRSK